MRRAATLLQLLLLFATEVLSKADINYDPDENYRPRNVTGLDYFYYPWIGSYAQLASPDHADCTLRISL